ncbi:MAG: hypothetical protein JJLCMIEE_03649 [Acidimicrobiales bacterium]|nr:MAG: hypothetical protein EDR02_11890 [Actinomycetota bacterium]MBV6510493.1 hypothetical protein [Acidimicrobiales bacterium]RIK07153.1 MAG: hypothetical protein DCC48_05050 [Acidobacteriota bacterium]
MTDPSETSAEPSTVEEEATLLLRRFWWAWLGWALVGLAFGLILLFWPKSTALVLTVIAGMALVILGVGDAVYGVAARGASNASLFILRGVVKVAIGVAVLAWPGETVLVFAVLFGLLLIIVGAIELYLTISMPDIENRVLWFVISGLTIAAGIAVRVWPQPSLKLMAAVLGVYLVVSSLFDAVDAIAHRHIVDEADVILEADI